MKKNLLNTIFILVILSITISSCDKSEIQEQSKIISSNTISLKSTSTFNPVFLVNKDNPYDKYGLKMNAFYTDISILFHDSIYSDYFLFEATYNKLLEMHSENLYPSIDTTLFSEYESNIISNFTKSLFVKNIKEVSQKYETNIITDRNLKMPQKQRLLAFVSLYKFSYYYQSEIMSMYATWEERHHDCMVKELNHIFADDGNPLPELFFILGQPKSAIELALICAWEATFCSK
jgi:hypothetical protein